MTTKTPVFVFSLLIILLNYTFLLFQFQTFSIYPQKEGTAAASARPTTDFGSVGHCENDGFSIASPGNAGSPVICGYNSNQHSNIFSIVRN